MVVHAPGLIPARFLTLLSHFTILVLVLYSSKDNVEACMTLDWTENDFNLKNSQLITGVATSIFLIGIELVGFLFGVSMFMPSAAIISTAGHFGGSVALSYFIFDQWDCNLFWWVFAFCSLIPGILEIIIGVQVLILRKF